MIVNHVESYNPNNPRLSFKNQNQASPRGNTKTSLKNASNQVQPSSSQYSQHNGLIYSFQNPNSNPNQNNMIPTSNMPYQSPYHPVYVQSHPQNYQISNGTGNIPVYQSVAINQPIEPYYSGGVRSLYVDNSHPETLHYQQNVHFQTGFNSTGSSFNKWFSILFMIHRKGIQHINLCDHFNLFYY